MHSALILGHLRAKLGPSAVRQIAEQLGMHPASVYNTIYRRPFHSPRAAEAIAEVIGQPAEEIWPEKEAVAA